MIDALAYALRGWPVMPLRSGTKRPLVGAGNKGMTLDPERIKELWTRYPDANIAMATGSQSGIVVVDLDIREAVNGVENWGSASHEIDTLASSSARGGIHLFYSYTGLFSTQLSRETGIDIWGEHGSITLPPSVVSGVEYRWLNDLPVAPLPNWLLPVKN